MRIIFNSKRQLETKREVWPSSVNELMQSKSEEKNYSFKSFLFPKIYNEHHLYDIPLFLTKNLNTELLKTYRNYTRSSSKCFKFKLKTKQKYILKSSSSVLKIKPKSTQINEQLPKLNKAKNQKKNTVLIKAIDNNQKKEQFKIQKLNAKLHQKTKSLSILITNARFKNNNIQIRTYKKSPCMK